ncbi:MAG: lysylphosphatidylglycerol synthase domain-containing protein, partial [Gemmatimonadetes bacterium]|nr:lysylphosphatidylglycerol synthase domain-containing protein [Gemmatimonadota bacterium]
NRPARFVTGRVLTVVGLGLVVAHWDLPQALPLPVKAGLAGLGLLAAALTAALYLKRRSMFSSLLAVFRAVGLGDFAARQMDRAVRTDAGIGRFYGEHKPRFALVMFFHALGWMLGACETWVILEVLGAGTNFEIAFLITALTVLINSLFFFMPSNIGVLEGGGVFLFITLGLNPALGLSLGIVKRMRKIVWISIGWLFLTYLGRASASVRVHLGEDRGSAAGRAEGLGGNLTPR